MLANENIFSKLSISPSLINGVLVLEAGIFEDNRGWLTESFNAQDFFSLTGLDVQFVQDNHCFSKQWTLRGMHYQWEQTQGKLVRVVSGSVFDVVIDVRKESPTYGKWMGIELSAQNRKQLWIPPGLAHGFLVLSDAAEFLYKTTDYYHPQSEICIAWNDPMVGIEWPLPKGTPPNMNAKDMAGLPWNLAPKF